MNNTNTPNMTNQDKSAPEKIKVRYAKKFVNRNLEKPYYQISYYDLADNKVHVGFGSYDEKWVDQWMSECFQLVYSLPQEKPSL